jgi:hypothetical protein
MRPRTLSFAVGVAVAAMLGPHVATGAEPVQVTTERVVPEDRLARYVQVRDVRMRDDTVTGTIVNTTDRRLQDVRLVIRHLWLWNNEMHPGDDDPSRADYYTVPGEIPPGGQVPFTYRMDRPLPSRSGGHFETQAQVASLVEVTAGATPARAPTAGTAAPSEPPPYRTAPTAPSEPPPYRTAPPEE